MKIFKRILKIFLDQRQKANKKINLDNKLPKSNFSQLFNYFNTDKGKIFRRLDIKQKTNNYGPYYEKHFKKIKK